MVSNMRVATVAVAYREERLIGKYLSHIPDWVDEKLVLVSEKPWFGEELPEDKTIEIAESYGATVLQYNWANETDQRNAGQEYLSDYDFIIVLDPDEFFDKINWENLYTYMEVNKDVNAAVVNHQLTYWKNGYVADPPKDYQQLILVKPSVRFIDKRVVDSLYAVAPVYVHHFSWAKTDEEVWNKISHYAHANDFDVKDWYENVWLKWKEGMDDVHPVSPDTLHKLIPAKLPKEIEELNLWP